MSILAMLDLGLKIIEKLNLGAEAGIKFYQAVKTANPQDVPDKTDAEIITQMKEAFTANAEDIERTLAALRQTS